MNHIVFSILFAMGVLPSAPAPSKVDVVVKKFLTDTHVFSDIDRKKQLGFDSTAQLSDIQIEAPIRVYGIRPDAVKNAKTTTPVKALVHKTDRWICPVTCSGKNASSVILSKFGHYVKVDGFGDQSIGTLWPEVTRLWPESLGYHPMLVTYDAAGPSGISRFFHVPEKGDTNLTQLEPGHDNRILTSSSETIHYLQVLRLTAVKPNPPQRNIPKR